MLGWMGEDISPNTDGSIERFIVQKSEKKRSPNEGSFVKGNLQCNFIHTHYILKA